MFKTLAIGLAVLVTSSVVYAQNPTPPMVVPSHVTHDMSKIDWQDAPMLPPGAKVAVLEGPLDKSGPFTVIAKFPGNYMVPPHTHPNVEHVVVLKGVLYLGHGDKFEKKGTMLKVGDVSIMQPDVKHFAWTTKKETVILIYGNGPWGITYLNPNDDPRNKLKTSK